MSNDKIDQGKSTTRGAIEKNQEGTRNLADSADRAADKVVQAERLEDERDEIEDDYLETLKSVQSYMDQHGNAMGGIGQNVKALFDQIIADRRTFLKGLGLAGIVGALHADNENWLPWDGSYDPRPGEEQNSPNKHDDMDTWGTGWLWGNEEQGFEPGPVAGGVGSSGSSGAEVVKGYLDRNLVETAWNEIPRPQKFQLFESEDAYSLLSNDKGEEVAAMRAWYREDGTSEVEAITIEADRVDEGWRDTRSVNELLNDYGEHLTFMERNEVDDPVAEYMTDLQDAENPDKLDFTREYLAGDK